MDALQTARISTKSPSGAPGHRLDFPTEVPSLSKKPCFNEVRLDGFVRGCVDGCSFGWCRVWGKRNAGEAPSAVKGGRRNSCQCRAKPSFDAKNFSNFPGVRKNVVINFRVQSLSIPMPCLSITCSRSCCLKGQLFTVIIIPRNVSFSIVDSRVKQKPFNMCSPFQISILLIMDRGCQSVVIGEIPTEKRRNRRC
jgi:hypothetical protein